jgi:hypothetical protein
VHGKKLQTSCNIIFQLYLQLSNLSKWMQCYHAKCIYEDYDEVMYLIDTKWPNEIASLPM